MLRSSYYQPIGNPIQRSRLPKRPLGLTFPIRDLAHRLQTKALLYCCGLLFLVTIFESAAFAFVLEGKSQSAQHALVLLGGIALAFTLCITLKYREWMSIVGAGISIGAIGLALFAFSVLAMIPIMVAVGWYVRQYCEHWITFCTASPFPRHRRRQIINQWRSYLNVIQWLPTGLLIVVFLIQWPVVVVIVLLGLFTAVQTVHAISAFGLGNACLALKSSAESWCCYNFYNIDRPGTFKSPAGNRMCRILETAFLAIFIASMMRIAHADLVQQVSPHVPTFSLVPCIFVTLFSVFAPGMLMLPVIAEVMVLKNKLPPSNTWSVMTREMRLSSNPIERDSYFMGRVVADGSPLIVPRNIFREHAHFLGDSGSGKTSLGLSPFLEQTIGFGDCSVVIVDLKADSLELLATAMHAARKYRNQTGIDIPIKFLSNQDDLASFGLNVFSQSFWKTFNLYTKTDILCGATGLEYGADYGASYYSSTNAAVLHHTIKLYPEIATFEELADRCGYVIANAKNRDLHPEVRKAGVHVHEVYKRLGAFSQLNVSNQFDETVVNESINLDSVFQQPQILYFHLSSLLSPASSPAIARLVVYFLLAAATKNKRDCPVFLVIDEFQRMVAKNLEYMLQLARSMNVAIILANQSMEDLKSGTIDLVSPLESNCRYRQWFSVSSSEDRRRLVECSGETVELLTTRSVKSGELNGSTSISRAEHIMPRLSPNDVHLASDHPKQSVVKIGRGDGYAQFGGMPLKIESDYHISQEEYERRRRLHWPQDTPGTFIPEKVNSEVHQTRDAGPIITTDPPAGSGNPSTDIDQSFDSFLQQETLKSARRKKKQSRRRKQ